MYNIEKKTYGFKLTFGDFMPADEMRRWVSDSRKVLEGATGSFGVLVDMRTLKPLDADTQGYMQEGQKMYKSAGMERSAVALASTVVKMQFKRIAKQTGIYQWERYFDGSDPSWEGSALAWITDGTDPDL